jgi:hypothetical protein
VGKLNQGQKLPKGRRPAWIVSIEVGPTTMRRRPAWIVSEVGTTKWWVCRVVEEDSDWLGSHDWAPYKKSMDGKVRPIVQQSIDLLWVQVITSAECTKSIKILPVPGRSYERGKKGAHRSSNQPVKTDGYSSFE